LNGNNRNVSNLYNEDRCGDRSMIIIIVGNLYREFFLEADNTYPFNRKIQLELYCSQTVLEEIYLKLF